MLAGGYDTAEIAMEQRKARSTVAMQSRCILGRLGARNMAHATAIGFVNGLLDERDLQAGVESVPRRRPKIRGVKLRTEPLLPEYVNANGAQSDAGQPGHDRCRRGHEFTPENTIISS
jgi:hypothetical protein